MQCPKRDCRGNRGRKKDPKQVGVPQEVEDEYRDRGIWWKCSYCGFVWVEVFDDDFRRSGQPIIPIGWASPSGKFEPAPSLRGKPFAEMLKKGYRMAG